MVRDLFTEDFVKLVIQGDDAWETVQQYVAAHGARPRGAAREVRRPAEHGGNDLFAAYRLDEQIAKGLDRKVWLPSGGSLVIDRTEAMTVVDVNTGKFTGSGGNLEETVTKNNLEAAEEIVRQLRLRDIGGIIVVDFIDMVLESNRDLVLRRLVECLGRDRTRHQVAEVTSLGLVQMTRKRIGTGLLEAFSETCEHCQGRGLIMHEHPVEPEALRRRRRPLRRARATQPRRSGPGRRRRRATTATATATGTATAPRRRRPRTSPRWPARRPTMTDDDVVDDLSDEVVEVDDTDDVNDDLESLTSEVVESLDDRVEAVRREPLRARARAGAGAGAGARAGARAGEADGRHPHPPPERQPPGRAPARAGDRRDPHRDRHDARERSARRQPPGSSSRAPPGTATPVRQPRRPPRPHVEHVPIKRKGSRKR